MAVCSPRLRLLRKRSRLTPFRFTGQKLDPETGLYYYKARYYDAALGRFLQTDPIGYEDQMNLYAYVGNDLVNFFDPNGQEDMSAMDRRNAGALAAVRNPQAEIRVMAGAVATAVPFYAVMVAPAATTFVLSRAPQLNSAGVLAAEVAAGDALGGASLAGAAAVATRGLGGVRESWIRTDFD